MKLHLVILSGAESIRCTQGIHTRDHTCVGATVQESVHGFASVLSFPRTNATNHILEALRQILDDGH